MLLPIRRRPYVRRSAPVPLPRILDQDHEHHEDKIDSATDPLHQPGLATYEDNHSEGSRCRKDDHHVSERMVDGRPARQDPGDERGGLEAIDGVDHGPNGDDRPPGTLSYRSLHAPTPPRLLWHLHAASHPVDSQHERQPSPTVSSCPLGHPHREVVWVRNCPAVGLVHFIQEKGGTMSDGHEGTVAQDDTTCWEYRVLRVNVGPAAFQKYGPDTFDFEATLNDWGSAGWDVFHVQAFADNEALLLFLKRRVRSAAPTDIRQGC